MQLAEKGHRSYEFIGFGTLDAHLSYEFNEFIGFGAMYGNFPYEFIGSASIEISQIIPWQFRIEFLVPTF